MDHSTGSFKEKLETAEMLLRLNKAQVRQYQKRIAMSDHTTLQRGFVNWNLGIHRLSKTSSTKIGSVSIPEFRSFIKTGAFNNF